MTVRIVTNESDWEQKVAFMRACGVNAAEWHEDGSLRSASLGGDPRQSDAPKAARPPPDPRERARHVRAVVLASSPRVVEVSRAPGDT